MKRLIGIAGLAAIAFLLIGGAFAAQRSGKQATPGKIYWPEKEDVTVVRPGHVLTLDSCVPSWQFERPTTRPQAC